MAKEFKTLNVSTKDEERTIRAFQSFGWTLKNNQEIYVKDSHSEVWGNQRYSVTETTHYVKLSFERDGSKLRNYQQLRQLENAFYAISEPKVRPENRVLFICMYFLFGLLVLIGLTEHIFSLVLIGGLFVALFAYLHKRHISKMNAYNKCWRKREQIMAKAEQYLD